MAYESPLRYPGGKGRLANFIKLVLLQNNLVDGHYVEPYAGGAGIAFRLLFENYVHRIHINDISKSLFAFWRSVLDNTDELLKMISDTPVTIDIWERQHHVQLHPDSHSVLEVGFSTFFLNRTNRSGILSGGVIGGKEQKGKWKIDARYNKTNLMQRISRIARHRECIKIYNQDALGFISTLPCTLPQKTLFYIDPPYYNKGQTLYNNFYYPADHERLAQHIVHRLPRPWVVSYDNTAEICDLYKQCEQMSYKLPYSAADRREGSEVLIFASQVVAPVVVNPLRVSVHPQLELSL